MRELLTRYDALFSLADNQEILRHIPDNQVTSISVGGDGLDAASMMDMEQKKRYTVVLALIERQLAWVIGDLCVVFCKQMMKVQHQAEEELEDYLQANQDKTDEILRRFAKLDTLLQSDQSASEQISSAKQLVTERPDLCEFSRIHAEHGGKNESRFMWKYFKVRRSDLLRILTKLRLVATSQDESFERALAFVLTNHHRHAEWIELSGQQGSIVVSSRSASADNGFKN